MESAQEAHGIQPGGKPENVSILVVMESAQEGTSTASSRKFTMRFQSLL